MTSGQDRDSDRSRRCSSSSRHGKQWGTGADRTSATHGQGIVDDISLVIKTMQHRGDQPRSGHHVHPDRKPASRDGRRTGRVGERTVWGASNRQPARSSVVLHLAGLSTVNFGRPGALCSRLWGAGFLPSTRHQGVKPALERRSRCCTCPIPTGIERVDASPHARCESRTTESASGTKRVREIPEIRAAHRAVRDGLPHAGLGAGVDGSLRRARARVRTLWPRLAQAGHVCGQLPAGAPAGRA